MILLVALCLAVDVLFLTVQVQRLTKERDAALALRDDANDAMRRMAEERVHERIRASVFVDALPRRQAN